MKEQWSTSKDKLVALEEGTSRNEERECAKPAGRSNVCEQAIQCVKLVLYLGLLMIVGGACYSLWQTYRGQPMEVRVTDVIPEPESQNLLLLEEQRTRETSTIAARPIYEAEDPSKRQDAVDDLEKLAPDDQAGIIVSENTESSISWPTDTDYPDLPEATNFSLFLPSLPSMKVDEGENEPGSSDSAQRLFDNLSEESQPLKKDEPNLLENYMLLSLLVQNAVRISENLKDSKQVVDPKFEFKLEDLYQVELENSGALESEESSRLDSDEWGLLETEYSSALEFEDLDLFEWKDSDPLALPDLFPLEWEDAGPSEPQKDIGSDLEDSEERPSPTQTDDNHESAALNTSNNADEIVPEDSAEPKQEETLINSNEQTQESMDSGAEDWLRQIVSLERNHKTEQATESIASDGTEAEEENGEIPRTPFDFDDSIGNTYRFLGPRSVADGFPAKTERAVESESDSFDLERYQSLLTRAQIACFDTSLYSRELIDPEDTNNSSGTSLQDGCIERTKTFCEYRERTLQLADCAEYSLFRIRRHDYLRIHTQFT